MNNIQRIKKEQSRERRNRFFLNFVSASKRIIYVMVGVTFFLAAMWAFYVGLWAIFS